MVKVGDKVRIEDEGMATVLRVIGKLGQRVVVRFDVDGPDGFPVERFIEKEEVKA